MDEKLNAKKIATPPNDAIGRVCTFLSSGISYNLFLSAISITIGIAKNATIKEIIAEVII